MDEAKIIEVYNKGINEVISLVKNMNSGLTGEINNLNQHISDLNLQIGDLQNKNIELSSRLKELEARINKNSSNSSKPPSTDGYKKHVKNNRTKSGRLPGGQSGHEGSTLNKVDNPDKVVELNIPDTCTCGHDLKSVEDKFRSRQVFDIPKITLTVNEYMTHEKVCPICGKVHKTEFPSNVTQPVQYGENMKILMNYLTGYQFLPLGRAAEAIRDITNQTVSEGTIVNAQKQLYDVLEQPVNVIKERIINSDVVHFDETGMRSEGRTQWVHAASTESLTYYEAHDKRGAEAAKDIGILPKFKGTSVHDHWMPYYTFTDCTHGECNAHNVRYLKDIVDNYKQEWAGDMISLLVEIHRRVGNLKAEGFEGMGYGEIQTWQGKYHHIINEGIIEDSQKSPKVLTPKGKEVKSKPLLLLLKLQQYDIETLAFMYDFNVPFDNNLSERDLRMQKLRQKISGCFRGKEGADVFCRIRSYISTARKNGLTAMDAIARAVMGHPFIPET